VKGWKDEVRAGGRDTNGKTCRMRYDRGSILYGIYHDMQVRVGGRLMERLIGVILCDPRYRNVGDEIRRRISFHAGTQGSKL